VSSEPGASAPAAGSAETKTDANSPQSTHAGVDKREGRLRVVGLPVLTVTVDGHTYGDTPRTIKLRVGKHRVQLENAANNLHEVLPAVIINENQTTTIDRMPP
jgi:hypothetical protein